MRINKIIISNLYIIGTIIIVSGFVWMGMLATVPDNLDELLISFSFTVSGLIFWGIGYKYEDQGEELHIPKFPRLRHGNNKQK
ncbi:MAG: hypothetical protein ACTSUE_20595 [Promethearchaeota archaeon]